MTAAAAAPMLSVVICTYNRSFSLRQTLSSLADLDAGGLQGEILLVDNNSTDDTRAAAEAFLPRAPLPARYLFEPRQGLSHARNTGIDAASGDIVIFTDDDVLLDRHWLHEIARAFVQAKPAALGGKIVPKWPDAPPSWLGPELHQFLGLLDHGDAPKLMETPELWGANLAIRADVFRTLRFQDKLGRSGGKLYNGEDTDLLRALLDRGERVLYWPSAVVQHNIPQRRLTKRYFRKWHWDSGEMAARVMPPRTSRSLLGIPYHIYRSTARELAVWSRDTVARRGDAFLSELRLVRAAGFATTRVRGLLQRD
jgi:glycosyltransferase involved in cell wall biosynthesis